MDENLFILMTLITRTDKFLFFVTRKLSPCDKNKGIARIDYDMTNHPVRIQFTNGNVTEYVYSVSGEKLRTIYRTAVSNISVPMGTTHTLTQGETLSVDSTDYCFGGSLILRNGRLSRYLFDGGYCSFTRIPSIGNPQYATTFHYYQQDHLDNIREVINGNNGTVEQQTHYYPFGGIIADISTNQSMQPNKYNGKELDLMHGLNTYDYGARQYDPITITWNGVDPLAEKNVDTSPFSFCHNNSVNRIDPDGRDDYYTQDGRFLKTDDKETDHIIIRDEFSYKMNQNGLKWIKFDTPIEKTTLTAKAYSNIFTNVLGKMKEVNLNDLLGKRISVIVTPDDNLITDSFNKPYDRYIIGSTSNATTDWKNGKMRITANIINSGENDNRELFSTRSNIQNLLGIHEYVGHGIKKWGDANGKHKNVYELQMKHHTWKSTTIHFKQVEKNNYAQY